MRFRVLVVAESDAGEASLEVASLERTSAGMEDIGVSLAEAKALLAGVQWVVVEQQVAEYLRRQRDCPHCRRPRRHKGRHRLVLRTLFGDLSRASPRLFHSPCRPAETRTFSPLAGLLPEHVTPERRYLEAKWAAQISFEMTARLLADVLPLEGSVNAATVRNHLHAVAERDEAELGDERWSFIEGCPAQWAELPRPDGPLTVGIDGGFVRQWDNKKSHFEVIVGKSIPDAGAAKCFGFVQTFDAKPKRRLWELLRSQGLQLNQQLVFLSDGGESLRDLQSYLSPESEHYLDWFHITMRLTVLGQYAKGLGSPTDARRLDMLRHLERIKHYLWHGNVVRGLDEIEDLELFFYDENGKVVVNPKLVRAATEFRTYIYGNRHLIPNYGERWRNHERIATGFVESTVNHVVSKRFAKKQQMQWTQQGVHLLLQVRTKVLNGELERVFKRWYPGFQASPSEECQAAA